MHFTPKYDGINSKPDEKNHRLTLFYKMNHNLTPLYLTSLVPGSVGNVSRYNLCNANNLQGINTRTAQYQQSFLPSTIREWNELPNEAKECSSVNSFKYYLNKNREHTPKYFYTGNRKAQILHTRLRTNCSSLNLDLFLKNIVDTPHCNCGTGSIEDQQHNSFIVPIINYNELNCLTLFPFTKHLPCIFYYMAT